ncbi:MAG: AraC family transcriptional regulator [Marinobacter sp.]|nr:AraC family transcriptional regulator [Marinobacter sp.]
MNAPGITGNLPIIRAHYADILCQLAEELGVERRRLLADSGIRPALLGHPDNFITLDQFTNLCRAAVARTGDAALGLAFGLRLKFTTHGSLAQAAISCDTLAEALQVLIKYFRTRFVYMELTFIEEGNEAVLQLDPGHDVEDLYRFNVDVVMASLMDVNQLLFGDRLISTGWCKVNYPPPSDLEPYRRLFGDQIEFSAGANQLRFDRRLLSLPMSLSNPVTRRVAEAQCEEEMRSIEAATTMAARVTRILESVRDSRLPGLETVAEQLSLSTRTLRRQLASEGVRFQDLQDELRHRRALELLRRRELTIDEVADAVGYSDPSNFGRAFRKWEGMSPSTWRNHRFDQ